MEIPSLVYLSAEDVARCLPMADAIRAMREAFSQLASGAVTQPERQHLEVPEAHGAALYMPCHARGPKLLSLKIATVFHDNSAQGLPLVQSLLVLTDGATGTHEAVMDGASLTAIRTGAASGLATDLLARPDSHVAAIFGTGVQARTQLEAICQVRPIRRASVFGRRIPNAERFATEMAARLGIPVEPTPTPAQTLADADVVCAATSSAKPVFDDVNLPAGTHVNAVGAYRPDMTEIPAATICRAQIVVDHLPAALAEAGDLLVPWRQGLIGQEHFRTELGDVLVGRAPGRGDDRQITLFKSVGLAVQDLFAAMKVLANARRLGAGTPLT